MPPTKLLAAALLLIACGADRDTPPAAANDLAIVPVHTFPLMAQEGRELAFSADDSLLATSSADGVVGIWHVSDHTKLRTLSVPGGVTTVVFTPDGRRLVTGGYDRQLRVWRIADGSIEHAWQAHGGTVWTIDVSPDGKWIVSGGEDALVKLWRVADGGAVATLAGHERNVWRVRFSPDGRRLGSGSFDATARIWDVKAGPPLRTLAGHTEAVVGLAFSPDGSLIATGSDDSSVRIWRVSDGALLRTLPVGNHVYSVAFSPDGRWLATAGRSRSAPATFWHQVSSGRWDGESQGVRVWRVTDGTLAATLAGHTDDVWAVAFSHDGRWLATSSEDRTAKLWRIDAR